jgi:hypothetical protein
VAKRLNGSLQEIEITNKDDWIDVLFSAMTLNRKYPFLIANISNSTLKRNIPKMFYLYLA